MHFWPPNGFQSSLIASGAALVALVWLYNKWQERRQRRLTQRMFQTDHADVLLGAEGTEATAEDRTELRSEDAQDDTVPDEAVTIASPDGRIEPVFTLPDEDQPVAEAVAEKEIDAQADPADPPLDLADPQIDCLVHILAPEPIPLARCRAAAGLRWRWIGWSGQWRPLAARDAAPSRRLIAALQLADRRGPLGEVDLTRHLAAARQLATDFSATIEAPEPAAVLAAADQLDRFCAGVDWRLGIHVVSARGTAIDGAALTALAEASGLRSDADGSYRAEDESGQCQFTLTASPAGAGSPAGVKLSLDVPLVADGPGAFDRLLSLARKLAAQQDGLLVDEQRAPLAEGVLAQIRAKIEEFQQKMAASDIPAGGRRARRLYS